MSALYGVILTTIAHLSKVIVGFIFLKVMAVYLGVEGMGFIGHFMSFVAILFLLAGGGIVNGIIKYVAEYQKQTRTLLKFILAVKTYSILICFIVLVLGVMFSSELSLYLFKSKDYQWLIIALSIAQFGFSFVNIITGVINGLRDTKTYAIIQVCGNLLVLPIIWFLIAFYGIKGAALSVILFFLLHSIPACYFYCRSSFRHKVNGLWLDKKHIIMLSSYTAMALVGAVSFPLVEIFIREMIISYEGYSAAGMWQASIKLSGAYMGFFVVFLSVYFMPMISAKDNALAIGPIVFKFILMAMAFFFIGGGAFYLSRGWLIPLLLSEEFIGLGELIHFQLLGDFFRVSAYVIGFVVIAKAALKIYLICELSQGILFYLSSQYFLQQGLGLKGVFIGHLLMNFIYFCCAVIGFLVYIKRVERKYVNC